MAEKVAGGVLVAIVLTIVYSSFILPVVQEINALSEQISVAK